jgi:hypothetical protein
MISNINAFAGSLPKNPDGIRWLAMVAITDWVKCDLLGTGISILIDRSIRQSSTSQNVMDHHVRLGYSMRRRDGTDEPTLTA